MVTIVAYSRQVFYSLVGDLRVALRFVVDLKLLRGPAQPALVLVHFKPPGPLGLPLGTLVVAL